MLSKEQALAEAIRVVNKTFVGLLTTVGPDGMPCSRWMGTATLADGLHKLYTLSALDSRKVLHIRAHPQVCWAFSCPECEDVATLFGAGRVLTSPLVMQQVFDRLQDHARLWCMGPLGNAGDIEFATIETEVQRVEYLSPRLEIYRPIEIELPRR